MSIPTCRSCGQPIIWARANTGDWLPLDPDPNPRGQVILLDGDRCYPVEPGGTYGSDVQARRHWNHHTTCALAPSARTITGSLRDGLRGTVSQRREQVRRRQLEFDRQRD